MDIVLPKEIAYAPSLPSLPEAISSEIVLSPVNGNTFGPSQLIQFDLTARGFIDPSSVYIRYRYTLTNANGTDTSGLKGTPIYSFFSKLETIIGSTIYESITNYNQVLNMWMNLQYDVAQKYGMQSAFGYNATQPATVPSLEQLDGRLCANAESVSLAGPLACLISSAEKLWPAGLMPNVRIQLTTESIANAFYATMAPTNYTLSNVELCYTMIDFAGGVNDLVKSMGEKIYIKSSSFQNMGASLGAGVLGTTELVYNMRLASIKSLFAHFSGLNSTYSLNGIFDSVDPTRSTGDLQFNVAGTYYPSRPVSTIYNKSGALMELKKAVGALHSDDFNFSINTNEFSANDNTATAMSIPGKFYFGVNTEKLSTNGALLTGISTQNSAITLRINNSQAGGTIQAFTVYLIAMYDCLVEVDPVNRIATVKQ